jgi:dipicolinate synthase subunit A
MIAEMHRDAVIYDIASFPGGTDSAAAEKYHIPVIQALGLPGRYTTKSSAKILADAILRQTLPKQAVREGKSWIFQIII